jgi:uncharacterized protein
MSIAAVRGDSHERTGQRQNEAPSAGTGLPGRRPLSPAATSAFVIAAFLLAYHTRDLLFTSGTFRTFYAAYPWQVGETVWKGLWVAIAAAALMMAYRIRPTAALRELGLARPPAIPLAAALIAAAPMLVVFPFLFPINPGLSVLALWMTGLVSPVSEEVLFRGFLFRQLHQRAGWPFLPAVLVSVAPFVWGHLHQADSLGAGAWGALAVAVITGAGAALFAWLLVRWDYNLWFAIGLHAFMNLAWYVFDVSDTAVGGWIANGVRLFVVAAAILITRRRERWFGGSAA